MKLLPILVLLVLAGTAAAEEETDILTRLVSATPAEQAWGAHLAGKQGVQSAIPRLIEMIGSVPHRKDKEGRLVVRAAFDALIRLKAPVSADVLEPHLGGYFSTQALILLSRAPKLPPDVTLRLFERQGSDRMGRFGIAVGNLLCAARAPGFAAQLLRHVGKLRLEVSIVEEGFGGRLGGLSIGGMAGDGRIDVPEGFPPTVLYQLSDRASKGSVLLADGPRPIRWYRTERSGRKIGFGSTGSIVELTELAREWLAVLSSTGLDELKLPATSSASLVWTDAAAYVKHVAKRRDVLLARYWKLVAALLTQKALTLNEAQALVPQVTVRVHDDRKTPSKGEFPKIPAPPKRPRLPGEEAAAR